MFSLLLGSTEGQACMKWDLAKALSIRAGLGPLAGPPKFRATTKASSQARPGPARPIDGQPDLDSELLTLRPAKPSNQKAKTLIVF